MPDLSDAPPMITLSHQRPDDPTNIVNAMAEHQAMMDAIRDGLVNRARAGIPDTPIERSNHLKSFGYFSDALMVGIGPVPKSALLSAPRLNPEVTRLVEALRTRQTKTLASGIDMIMADLKDAMEAPPATIDGHGSAIVFLYEHPRKPTPNELGVGRLSRTDGCSIHSSGSASESPWSRRRWNWPMMSRFSPVNVRIGGGPWGSVPHDLASMETPSPSATMSMAHIRSNP